MAPEIACICAEIAMRIFALQMRGGPTRADIDRVCAYETARISKQPDLLPAELDRLIDAVSVMAFAPGGVVFAGEHFVGAQAP